MNTSMMNSSSRSSNRHNPLRNSLVKVCRLIILAIISCWFMHLLCHDCHESYNNDGRHNHYSSGIGIGMAVEAFSVSHAHAFAVKKCQHTRTYEYNTFRRHMLQHADGSEGRKEDDDEEIVLDLAGDVEIDESDAWELAESMTSRPYISTLVREMDEDQKNNFLIGALEDMDGSANKTDVDPLWEQLKMEAEMALGPEPQAGPQLYQHILSQNSLLDAIIHVVSNEIATDLILATEMSNLFHSMLKPEDSRSIHLDIMAAAMRSPSVGNALTAVLFNNGLHALVCHRVSHRLWKAGRHGLAKYLQSTVSRKYQCCIHPAASFGSGIFMNCGSGIVIGETAVIGDDCSILQGVTLGGTGKERGDRHPKIGAGVVLQDSASVLGNIVIGDGAVITAKSIVTKPVPPLARVSGVPAKVKSFREPIVEHTTILEMDSNGNESFEQHLQYKYLKLWQSASSGEDHEK